MSSTYGACASASISLPRMLRSQTQKKSFFTPSLISISVLHSNWLPQPLSRRYGNTLCWSSARHSSTSHYHQAIVEASILNLDFLRPSHRKGNWNSPDLAPPSSHNIRTSPRPLRIGTGCRHVSKRSRSFLQWCWPPTKKPGESALRPDDLPLLPSFLNDANGSILGRSKVGKPSNELKLRCTEVNENGDVTLVNGEFKKSELIAKVCTWTPEQDKRAHGSDHSVWPSSPRSSENRFLPPPTYPHPALRHSYQPPSPTGTHQA